ncbi:MAG: pantetheine-phosphate adenylyltransferase [Planctomycetota bacterium]
MRRAIYPGTFDPPHLGHIDLIARGRALVDELIVAVAVNPDKRARFSSRERVSFLDECTRELEGVRTVEFSGLVVDLLRREGAGFILRGIRTFADFEAEYTMALTNRKLAGNQPAETIFVLPSLEYLHFSSRLVKEIASFGGDVRAFLPEKVADRIIEGLEAGGDG